jgi:hypothetical protein
VRNKTVCHNLIQTGPFLIKKIFLSISSLTLPHTAIAGSQGRIALGISHIFFEVSHDSTGKKMHKGQALSDDSGERELIFKNCFGFGTIYSVPLLDSVNALR